MDKSVVELVPIFRSRTTALRMISIWNDYRDRYGVKIVGYVVMPNYIH